MNVENTSEMVVQFLNSVSWKILFAHLGRYCFPFNVNKKIVKVSQVGNVGKYEKKGNNWNKMDKDDEMINKKVVCTNYPEIFPFVYSFNHTTLNLEGIKIVHTLVEGWRG